MALLCAVGLTGCATYKSKYAEPLAPLAEQGNKEVSHTFYLIGDAGLSPMGGMNPVLAGLAERLKEAPENSTALFLGDNSYPAGLPDPTDSTKAYMRAKNHLDAQLNALQGYKGNPIFIPGNHDWYNQGLEGLERQQEYVRAALHEKEAFLPKNGCPIEVKVINDDVAVIFLDTEWYLTNWDKHPKMNDKCEIKSREKFFLELEDAIKDHKDRTTLIAMHHPMTSYGNHGGQYSLKQHLYPTKLPVPLPVLGTFINVLRRTTGASITDLQNKRYLELRKRITTLAQYSDRVIFAAGHEHTLQYIVENNIPQIVSGSGAKKGESRLLNGSRFSTGHRGYAVLEVYTDGSSKVAFFGVDDQGQEEPLFTSTVLTAPEEDTERNFDGPFPPTQKAAIYTQDEITKSGFYKFVWGNRYRSLYGTEVTAPVVVLDTLFGGLVPVKKGGGHQSKSLRLRDREGREYVMRALRKSAGLYLQSMAFQDQYLMEELNDTYTQELMQDFYTGAHPYAPFTIARLSDAVGIYHTNPVLYYVPKQTILGTYNADFGDELYMIEEHAGDGHGHLASFGYADELKSTDAMLEDLRDDESYMVDAGAYLRARLFDMVIGDWDRHVDQWRWARFKDKKRTVYHPVARDRDQAFSIMGDGALMQLATRMVPGLRLMEGFKEEIRSVKGFNSSPKTYVLDLALLSQTTKAQWIAEANYLKEHLTAQEVEAAFEAFPEEVRDGTLPELKRILLARLQNIDETALAYYGILNKYALITGTDKDDWFEVKRLDADQTHIQGYRNIKGKKEKKFYDKVFDGKTTKEIWIYGLDDDDRFEVRNETDVKGIQIRIVGGQNNDVYTVANGRNIAIYDQKSKPNTFVALAGAKKKLTDDYNVNTYRPLDIRSSVNQFVPTIGFNPDDGIKIGMANTYTFNGFRKNPFTQQHQVQAAYYFATSGFELSYRGEFAEVFENWNFEVHTRFTSPNFAINFFGFGNSSENEDDALGLDYNRVRIQRFEMSPSLVWRGPLGATVRAGLSYESVAVEETEDRFINTFYQQNGAETTNDFAGGHLEYTFENRDYKGFPTMGMATSLQVGYKRNLMDSGQRFGYIIPSLSLDYMLVPSGQLVLATKWKAHLNLGNGYEFFQAASIGGVDGLRGFRNQRFAGKTAYYQNTDLRYSFTEIKTRILPSTLGVFASFDYGRVWLPQDTDNFWHTSYGGGFFFNASNILSFNTALFYAAEGPRFTFGLGFGF